MPDFPKQTVSQQLGYRGELIFQQMLPPSWNFYRPAKDLGVDFIVEVWDESELPKPLALQFAAQVKCHRVLPRGQNSAPSSVLTDSVTQPRVVYESLKVSSFNYLAQRNGQLFSLFIGDRSTDYLTQLSDLFDPDSQWYLANSLQNKPYYAKDEPELFFVSNIRGISDLLAEFNIDVPDSRIKIPLLPHNSNRNCSNFNKTVLRSEGFIRLEGRLTHSIPVEYWQQLEYDLTQLSNQDELIFYPSWKSKIIHSISIRRHAQLEKIRYMPFYLGDIVEGALRSLFEANRNDLSMVIEILLAISFCDKTKKFNWIENLISEDHGALNYMVLRCMRIHRITPMQKTIEIYLKNVEGRFFSIHSFFASETKGNEFIMAYIDLLIGYLAEILQSGQIEYLDRLFTCLIEMKSEGVFALFGQLTNGRNDGPLLDFIGRVMQRLNGETGPTSFDSPTIVHMAADLGIHCFDYEWPYH